MHTRRYSTYSELHSCHSSELDTLRQKLRIRNSNPSHLRQGGSRLCAHVLCCVPPFCALPSQIPVVAGFGVFVTTTSSESHTTLPSCFQEHFRSFALTPPPPGLFFRVQAAILGYRQPRLLADRLMMLYNLSKEQL